MNDERGANATWRQAQDLGWKRAGTFNLHIRLGQMTMAWLAQALIHQLGRRLGAPFNQWDAAHFARDLFEAPDFNRIPMSRLPEARTAESDRVPQV